ncbi:MAG: alpha/beta fold hydrolase [Thermoanaerobaculia bacterium]
MNRRVFVALFLAALLRPAAARTTDPPAFSPSVREGDALFSDVRFASGETLPAVRLHYRTLGSPVRDANGRVTNAVLVLHGTGGSGAPFLSPSFGGKLFGAGQPLDATSYFIILPDSVGHGGSSKPSDGLRTKFPRYTYDDMVALQRRLLVEALGVSHLRLVMGTSMGGMHTWVWATTYPADMDALFPLAALPVAITGRNRMWRKMAMDLIRDDPGFRSGEYRTQPYGLRGALSLMLFVIDSPWRWQKEAPTSKEADAAVAAWMKDRLARTDANDLLYALDASRDYDPEPALDRIVAPVVAVNSSDDVINPPELKLLERGMAKVKNGKAVVVPLSESTHGHLTHSQPDIWIPYLRELLSATSR